MARSQVDVGGVDGDFLRSFLESLEAVEQEACGYGSLKSAVIVAEDDGVEVTAVYADGKWKVGT